VSNKASEIRCAGCGKKVCAWRTVVRVTLGQFQRGEFATASEWGVFHEECFRSSVESPELAMAEVKSIAQRAKKSG
jgi:hypothetical protein